MNDIYVNYYANIEMSKQDHLRINGGNGRTAVLDENFIKIVFIMQQITHLQ